MREIYPFTSEWLICLQGVSLMNLRQGLMDYTMTAHAQVAMYVKAQDPWLSIKGNLVCIRLGNTYYLIKILWHSNRKER